MKYLTLLCLFDIALANEDKTLGMSQTNPATSCHEIYQRTPTSRGSVGQYWIKTSEGLFEVICNMKLKCGGVEGGWMQVVDVDMNRDDNCPGTWSRITTPRRLCLGYVAGCSSAHFYEKGVEYQHICGQAIAYQKYSPDAFGTATKFIDGVYVEGVSITLGSPHKHVWTSAVGISDDHDNNDYNCPSATHPGPPPPVFVRNHYYCESGNVGEWNNFYYLSDPLWDGTGCGISNSCCSQISMQWFLEN